MVQGRRFAVSCVAFILGAVISIQAVGFAQAQGAFGELLGNLINMAMIRGSWDKLGTNMLSCVERQLQSQGTSVEGLVNRGVTAEQPQIQPYIQQCQRIEAVARAWRSTDAAAKVCVARLLQANNQTIPMLIDMGLGPGDAQVAPFFNDCQQIDFARKAWATVDATVNLCAEHALKRSGQSIEILATQKVGPADPPAAPIMSQCQLISSQNLLKNVVCAIDGSNSRCDEAYVLESAMTTPLTGDQLVIALIAGQSIGKAQIEIATAKAARLAAIAQRRKAALAEQGIKRLAPLLDPANKFSFGKATDLRRQIDAARVNPKSTEADLLKLESATRSLVDANIAEIERQRVRLQDMASRGEVPISGQASGPNQKSARIEVYSQVFDRQLRDFLGNQVDGDIGQQFRKQANANLDKFRSDYFTGATKDTCKKESNSFVCSIDGVFKAGTLKTEVQKIMSATLSAPDKSYRFILGYEEKDGEERRFLIDSIRAEFINSGYKIIAKGAEDQARERGEFDYYLNILDISYNDGSSDVGSIGSSGASVFENYVLNARVKLLDNNKDPAARQELANVPVINTKRLPRDSQTPKDARRSQLLPMQASELAKQIYRDISARLLTLNTGDKGSVSAQTGRVKMQGQYSIRIQGVTQRDRDKIRALRNAVTKVLSGAETHVDPDGTNDKSVEITFEYSNKFDPEDLVDAIYDVFKERKKTFKVKYEGNNSFSGSL